MPDELVELLKDANRTFKEKFENAYAAARWVEKAKKQRIEENPAAKPAEVKKEQRDAEVRSRKEQKDAN
eukprot:7120796-Karenia_brevis.AAC.1